MSNGPIGQSGLSTAGVLATYVGTEAIRQGRILGNPLRVFTNVSADIASQGQAVNVWSAPVVDTNLLSDGSSVTLDDSAGTSVAVTLNKHRHAAIELGPVASVLGGDIRAQELIKTMVTSLYNDTMEDILSCITSGLTSYVGTYNTALTIATLQAANAVLDGNNAPGSRVGLIRHGAKGWDALKLLPEFSRQDYRGTVSPLVAGNPNMINYDGVDYAKCQALPLATNNTDNCILAPGALSIAMRPFNVPGSPGQESFNFADQESGMAFTLTLAFNSDKISPRIIVHNLYGYSVTSTRYGVLVKS